MPYDITVNGGGDSHHTQFTNVRSFQGDIWMAIDDVDLPHTGTWGQFEWVELTFDFVDGNGNAVITKTFRRYWGQPMAGVKIGTLPTRQYLRLRMRNGKAKVWQKKTVHLIGGNQMVTLPHATCPPGSSFNQWPSHMVQGCSFYLDFVAAIGATQGITGPH